MKFDDYPEEAKCLITSLKASDKNKTREIQQLKSTIADLKKDIRILLKANDDLSTDIYTYRAETIRMRRMVETIVEECDKRVQDMQSIQIEVDKLRRDNKNLKLWMEIKGVRKKVKDD